MLARSFDRIKYVEHIVLKLTLDVEIQGAGLTVPPILSIMSTNSIPHMNGNDFCKR